MGASSKEISIIDVSIIKGKEFDVQPQPISLSTYHLLHFQPATYPFLLGSQPITYPFLLCSQPT